MTQHLFIGVDGGATKCIVRVEDEAGALLGRETSGPANIRNSIDQTWQSIHSALDNILQQCSLSLQSPGYQFHVGMGLAGCEVIEAYQAFIQGTHPFATMLVSTDSHTACLGAHAGGDGAIIIAGTGVVGFQSQHGQTLKVGGFGFPHDDDGGGAWLGLQSVKTTLQWRDGRLPASGLAEIIYDHFGRDENRLVSWATQANSTAFAELAPFVIQQSQAGDATALALMQQAGQAIDRVGHALYAAQVDKTKPLPCSLIGGIVPFLVPYLGEELYSRMQPHQLPPDAGAVLLVRHHLRASHE
ncbi:MAG: N-acetylglucosamine kinase [Gammaproteobacteria bacterium]|nr:MAG: N-acetylglucosamine kinase [Gammaproteobacteria bacterium]